jgi:hypothetical protein
MGRMKEVCIQIMEANNGIPEGMTIGDVARMKEMEIYNWKEYEQQQEKNRQWQFKSENSGETAKAFETTREFTEYFKEARKEERKRNKQ